MNYEELKRLYDEASDKYDEAEKEFERIHKNDKKFPEYNVFREYMKPYAAEVKKYRLLMISVQPYTLSSFDEEDGAYMSLEEFRDACGCGAFIDYDGYGNLCIGRQKTNIDIYPSDVVRNNPDLSKFDSVLWYNR